MNKPAATAILALALFPVAAVGVEPVPEWKASRIDDPITGKQTCYAFSPWVESKRISDAYADMTASLRFRILNAKRRSGEFHFVFSSGGNSGVNTSSSACDYEETAGGDIEEQCWVRAAGPNGRKAIKIIPKQEQRLRLGQMFGSRFLANNLATGGNVLVEIPWYDSPSSLWTFVGRGFTEAVEEAALLCRKK